MGGLGRQGQDLSALFDKELQRQQRTNYETRSQTETRADRQEGESALDRIRDLARRQEELSRRQRELANAAPSGGGAEAAAREADAGAGGASPAGRGADAPDGPAGRRSRSVAQSRSRVRPGGGAMRDAAEQMRSAAGELQRQSPATAADRGERAAAGLRRLEQQMRRDNPEAQQRAAGEVRLEAQQIADEQRRIAGEAARLAKGTDAANADAWRRLSGEKDKLADRVDALQRTAEQLGGTDKPSPQGTAGKPGGGRDKGDRPSADCRPHA